MQKLENAKVFDRKALEEEIRATNEEIMLKQLEKQKRKNEEWLLRERQEAISEAIQKRERKDREKFQKLGFVILKAYCKRSLLDKRKAGAAQIHSERKKKGTLRAVFRALRKFSSS